MLMIFSKKILTECPHCQKSQKIPDCYDDTEVLCIFCKKEFEAKKFDPYDLYEYRNPPRPNPPIEIKPTPVVEEDPAFFLAIIGFLEIALSIAGAVISAGTESVIYLVGCEITFCLGVLMLGLHRLINLIAKNQKK